MSRKVLNGLDVIGDVVMSKTGYVGAIINSKTSGDPYFAFQLDGTDKSSVNWDRAGNRLAFWLNGSNRVFIQPAGELIVGADAVVLAPSGTITATGAVFATEAYFTKTGYAGVTFNSLTSGDPFMTWRLDGADKASFYFSRSSNKLGFWITGTEWMTLSTTGVLAAQGLVDASTAGLRTKHESAATPTGGNSGEVRVGTDKLWVQDAGTWKSAAVSAAGEPSFASTTKWGTD